MTKYGYARVSTRGQFTNGNSLEDQVAKLKDEGCGVIFEEVYTGTKTDRPKFKELMELLQEGDTLVITKLDRFARSTMDAISSIRELFERGVRVHILNMGIVENTPTGRLVFTIMSGFAEFERDMIVERTQEGKALAKLDPDFTEGRPKKFSKKKMDRAMRLLETMSLRQVEEEEGISISTLKREKAKRKAAQLEKEAK